MQKESKTKTFDGVKKLTLPELSVGSRCTEFMEKERKIGDMLLWF